MLIELIKESEIQTAASVLNDLHSVSLDDLRTQLENTVRPLGVQLKDEFDAIVMTLTEHSSNLKSLAERTATIERQILTTERDIPNDFAPHLQFSDRIDREVLRENRRIANAIRQSRLDLTKLRLRLEGLAAEVVGAEIEYFNISLNVLAPVRAIGVAARLPQVGEETPLRKELSSAVGNVLSLLSGLNDLIAFLDALTSGLGLAGSIKRIMEGVDEDANWTTSLVAVQIVIHSIWLVKQVDNIDDDVISGIRALAPTMDEEIRETIPALLSAYEDQIHNLSVELFDRIRRDP